MRKMPFKSVTEASDYYRDLSRKAILFALGAGIVLGVYIGLVVAKIL
jgi:hypothetical protein